MQRRPRRLRILRYGSLLLLVALGAGVGWGLLAFGRVAAGYAATVTALRVFGAGDSLADVEAEISFPFGLGRFVALEADASTRMARATVFGLVTSEARWREGLGATRVAGDSRALPEDLSDPVPALSPALPWPQGESSALAPVPGALRVALDAAVESAFVDPRGATIQTHAVVVVHAGRLVAERYRAGVDEDEPLLGWSMTKSLVATLVGRLIALGAARGVAEPVLAPEWSAPDDPRNAISVEHLLRMTSGLEFLAEYSLPWSDSLQMLFVAPGAAQFAAEKPLEHPPGTVWSYSDGSSNLLSRWVQERAGGTLEEQLSFLARELFAPLHMSTAVLSVDSRGNWVGSSLMQASARDWARLGLLYADDGVFEGRRLVPEGWVDFVSAPTATSPFRAYGAHVWRYDPELLRDADGRPVPRDLAGIFYFAGHDQQYVWIDRARRVVVVRLGMLDERFQPAAFAARIVRLPWE